MRDYVDEKLAAALYDVPVPEGLADRLLRSLAAGKNEHLTCGAAVPAAEAGETPAPQIILGRPLRTNNARAAGPYHSLLVARFSRRWLLSVGGLAAAAAALFVAIWLGMQSTETLSESFVLDEAIRSFGMEADEPGTLLAERSAPGDYPVSPAVLDIRGTRWRLLTEFLGRRGVVYDLPGPAGTHASLYVVKTEAVEGLGETPARRPFTTAGCCASAWQEKGLLYVLVVQGDPATYRAYLNLPQGPLA